MRVLLFLLFVPLSGVSQFAYQVDVSIPVRTGSQLPQPWTGGFNSVMVNALDLNGDGVQDLVLFERTANKVVPFLVKDSEYLHAPEYEALFPDDLNNFLLLRDLNNDGLKDIFTGNPFGIKVYINTTQNGSPLTWQHQTFATPGGGQSDVILTTGFSGKINLQLQSDDIPSITDMDGDGDLDILAMNFGGSGQIEYHKNNGTSSTPDFVRAQAWGGITECGCGSFAFNNEACTTAGRITHAGGKFLLTLDANADGQADLLFSESTCDKLYLLLNENTTDNALFTHATLFPNEIYANGLYPTAFFEDADFDGLKDILLSSGVFTRSDEEVDFSSSLRLFKNAGANNNLQLTTSSVLLQDQMLDVGENAAPAFLDYDSDGDQDMFIGYFGKLREGNFSGSIYAYENVGTAQAPLFEFITDDFDDLSEENLYNLRPQFVDINVDGRIDLAFTATRNSDGATLLYYKLNTSSSALVLEETLRATAFSVLFNENVHITDISNDGLRDLLVGKADGAVEYWRNTGSNTNPLWQLENETFLNINASVLRQNPSLFVADVNADGTQDLLLGTQNGVLFTLSDFRSHPDFARAEEELIFNPLTRQFENRNMGGRFWPVAVLLSGDLPHIVVGNMLGGLHVLRHIGAEPIFEVYPNPGSAHETLFIETRGHGTLTLVSTTGQQVQKFSIAKGLNEIILGNLNEGVYLLRFRGTGYAVSRRLVIINK